MLKRFIPLVPLATLAADCGGPVEFASLASEWRIDGMGDRDVTIDSHATDMCVAPNGTVYVIWVDDREGGDDIWFNRKLADGERHEGWLENAVRVNQFTDSGVWAPQLACTDTKVHIVWEDDRDGEVESHQIYYQSSTDLGDTWLEADLLLELDEDGRTQSLGPQIEAVDNFVYVTWYDDANGAYDIYATSSQDGGLNWQEPTRVDSDDAGSAWSAHPRLSVTADGQNVYVVWQDFRGGSGANVGSDIYFSRSVNRGIDFDVDQRLDGGDAGSASAFAPRIANATDGSQIYVVWHDDRSGKNDVFMTHSADGGVTWSTDSRPNASVQQGTTESLYPKICMTNGKAHVVWHDDRDAFYNVYHNTATGGAWDGLEERLDQYKEDGVRGVWRFDGGGDSVQLDCDGDNVLVAWLDTAEDLQDLDYNDIVYNFSADNGATWLVSTDPEDRLNWDNAPYRLDSMAAGQAYKTDLTIHLAGDLVKAAWTDGRFASEDVFFQQLTAGEEPEVLLTQTQANARL